MFGERRRHQRFAIQRAAKFQADVGTLPRDCMISDISESGARLFIEGLDAPDSFYLLINGDQSRREQCHVVWRLGAEVGVSFAKAADTDRLRTIKQIREEKPTWQGRVRVPAFGG